MFYILTLFNFLPIIESIIKQQITDTGAEKNAAYVPNKSFNTPVILNKTTYKMLLIVTIKPIANEEFCLKAELIITIKVGKVSEIKNPDIAIKISPFCFNRRPANINRAAENKNSFNPL